MPRPLSPTSAIIFKKLVKSELAMADLFDFLTSRSVFNISYRLTKEEYKDFKKRSWKRRVAANTALHEAEEKQHFYRLMNYLFKEGLVSKERRGVKTIVSLTSKGNEKYSAFQKYQLKHMPIDRPRMPKLHYAKKKSNMAIIVSFDVPEKEAHKRSWLRSVLKNLDYKLLHASVWMGTNELPEEFLNECRKINIMKYLHIFSVIKKGTIGA